MTQPASPIERRETPGKASAAFAAIVVAIGAYFAMPWEGKRNDVYLDIVKVATVCYGHTGKDVQQGQPKRTDAECARLLQEDYAVAYGHVQRCITVPIYPEQAAAFGGVRVRPLADMLAKATKASLLELPGDAAAVVAAARSQVGKPYDWLGVAGIGFRRRWQDEDAWFCSELVAWAFAEAGTPLFREHAWRITPRDIFIPLLSA